MDSNSRDTGTGGKSLPEDIKLVALDFDGVLTNNKVIVDQDGKESVQCDRSDSLGIEIISRAGVEVIVISKERNDVVLKRCEKIGIECHHGIDEKLDLLDKLVKKRGIRMSQVCFMGNDRNDVECMSEVGYSFAPNDAWQEAIDCADFVTNRAGGNGAVREMCEIIELSVSKKRVE